MTYVLGLLEGLFWRFFNIFVVTAERTFVCIFLKEKNVPRETLIYVTRETFLIFLIYVTRETFLIFLIYVTRETFSCYT